MRRLSLTSILLVALLALAGCAQQPPTADEIVQGIEQTRADLRAAHATVAFNFNGQEEASTMVIEGWMKKTATLGPDGEPISKLRAQVLESSKADLVGALIVSDGTHFWLHSPSRNEIVTGSVAEMRQQSPTSPAGAASALQDLLQQGLDATQLKVLGEERVAGLNAWKVQVTPKLEGKQAALLKGSFDSVMWVSDKERNKVLPLTLPLKLSLDASDFGSGLIETRSIEVNTELGDDLFSFTPPTGAKVVTAAELAAQMGGALAESRVVSLEEAKAAVSFPLLLPTSLPGDAALVEVRVAGDTTVILNYAGQGINLSLVQSTVRTGADRTPPAGSKIEEANVRGQPAVLITAGANQSGMLLRWQEQEVRFVVAGTITADQALAIAESMR